MRSMTELFREQFEREVAINRRVLEHVPEGRPDWKPHEKSMPLGYLALLVATMPGWVGMAIAQDELDLNPPGGGNQPQTWSTQADLIKLGDEAVAKGREALGGTTDAHLETPWRLLVAGKTVMESPRYVVIADSLTHMAHHRGQLSVYMRLNGEAVPSIYGPTADEKW